MAWGTIRRATDEDEQRLTAAAIRFARRYEIDLIGDENDAVFEIEGIVDLVRHSEWVPRPLTHRLPGYWMAVVRRALREPGAEGIAYGYVGYHVE